ncbi:MAG TPA: hypothetical protein VF798_05890 [Burkholderiaceae bacterium]
MLDACTIDGLREVLMRPVCASHEAVLVKCPCLPLTEPYSMDRYAPFLIAASAAILLLFGSLHLWYTVRGKLFKPRDAALEARMKEVAPLISRETTMWKAWVGFNASHSLGAMFFGLLYLYLSLQHQLFLMGEPVLLALGLLLLIGYNVLARAYWFSVPRRGIAVASVLYALALSLDWF